VSVKQKGSSSIIASEFKLLSIAEQYIFESAQLGITGLETFFGEQIYGDRNKRKDGIKPNTSKSSTLISPSGTSAGANQGSATGVTTQSTSPNSTANGSGSTAYRAASNSLSAASAAIGRGDFAAASRHLSNASRALGGAR